AGSSNVLTEPWREIPECRNNKENLNFVKSYSPKHPEVQHLKILLNGPVGAGKSSFISSVDSVLHGDIMCRALTNVKLVDGSFTKTYKTYRFLRQSDPNNPFGFSINDIVGLEESKGVHINDISLALKGHVKDGYKFKPSSPLTESDEGYNPSPTLQDRVHVLVSVIAADNETILTEEMQKKMREIRNIASELGISQLAILTRCDKACPAVADGMANLYKSKYLKGMADELGDKLGIPPNCIFLVKNYEEETRIRDDVDAPILCALRQIISSGDDFLTD
uniref:G domain-containing protein n=1 Tax=Tetraodon nigroviridis TaxID=99883 RepID=H3CIL2_TETNG